MEDIRYDDNSQRRLYSLDILKIISIVIILLHHFQQFSGLKFDNFINFYGGKFYFGTLVDLFFMISGFFVLGDIEKIQNGLSFRSYYFRKWIRFSPCLLVTSIAYGIVAICYENHFALLWEGRNVSIWGIMISSLGIQQGWMFEDKWINYQNWYVSVLLLCLIIFYFLVWLSKQKKLTVYYLFLLMIIIGIVIDRLGFNYPFLCPSTSRGYMCFFYGIILARIIKRIDKWQIVAASAFILITITFFLVSDRYSALMDGGGYLLKFVYFPSLIILFAKSKLINKITNFRIIGMISKISFHVYLWHVIVFIFLLIQFDKYSFDWIKYGWRSAVGYVLICFAIGVVSYFSIEKLVKLLINKMASFKLFCEDAERVK